MKRSTFGVALKIGLVFGVAVAMLAQGQTATSARTSSRPHAARAPVEVQIVPSRMEAGSTSIEVGSDRWNALGYDLKSLIAQVYDVDVRRVDLSGDVDTTARYDVTLSLPREESAEATQQRLRDALQKRFKLAITPESRSMDVYALTAPNGMGPALHRHGSTARGNSLYKQASLDLSDSSNDAQEISFAGRECSGVASGGISARAASISEFSRTLEPDLDRLLVNDTRMAGSFDFRVGTYRNQEELFQRLRDELGLVVVPTQRKVLVLTVRPS
ncbi:MAG: TIGR03435 family protein [Acidobacteriaceae bacterium]|nr:TIGR03435 family protein [Acidobacteriaceae bacterium]